MDTIFAPATAAGRAGVAVIRISGPLALDAARALGAALAVPRRLERVVLHDGGAVLDSGLAVSFPRPASYTGEDCVELHVHGGRATLRAVLSSLSRRSGLRLADPGEFTRRALENGKMDLAEAEGLVDLIDAETDVQRRQALRQMDGELGRQAEVWREALLGALAFLEAAIDFADEDLPTSLVAEATTILVGLRAELLRNLQGGTAARAVRNGFEVAIVGPPNIGKSTLINAISRRDIALVSDVPGTTRDVIEVRVDLHGLPVTFLDTAGLRETEDALEEMGVARGKIRAEQADLRVVLVANADDLPPGQPDTIFRVGQCDRHPLAGSGVSGKTGEGVADLLREIADRLASRAADAGVIVQLRHHHAVAEAISEIEDALHDLPGRLDVGCEGVRRAATSLARLTGRVEAEDVLAQIFSRFCIGK